MVLVADECSKAGWVDRHILGVVLVPVEGSMQDMVVGTLVHTLEGILVETVVGMAVLQVAVLYPVTLGEEEVGLVL